MGGVGRIRKSSKAKVRCTERAEVVNAAIVHGKNGIQRQIVKVHTKFSVVCADSPREIIRELVALFRTLDERVRLATEIREAWDVHRRIGSARDSCVVEIR